MKRVEYLSRQYFGQVIKVRFPGGVFRRSCVVGRDLKHEKILVDTGELLGPGVPVVYAVGVERLE